MKIQFVFNVKMNEDIEMVIFEQLGISQCPPGGCRGRRRRADHLQDRLFRIHSGEEASELQLDQGRRYVTHVALREH